MRCFRRELLGFSAHSNSKSSARDESYPVLPYKAIFSAFIRTVDSFVRFDTIQTNKNHFKSNLECIKLLFRETIEHNFKIFGQVPTILKKRLQKWCKNI